MPKIDDAFRESELTVTPAEGDTSVTIAHLARFCGFDMPRALDTRPHCAAMHAVEDQFRWETVAVEIDYHGAAMARFRDGSVLRIRPAEESE